MNTDYLAKFDRVVMKKCNDYRTTENATLNNIASGRVSSSLAGGGYVAQKPITTKALTELLKSRNQYDDVKRHAATNGLSVGHYLEEATKTLNNNFVTLADLVAAHLPSGDYMNVADYLQNAFLSSSSSVSSSSASSSASSSSASSLASANSAMSGFSHTHSDDMDDDYFPTSAYGRILPALVEQTSQSSQQTSQTYAPFNQYLTPPRPGHIGADLQAQGGKGRPIQVIVPREIQQELSGSAGFLS